MESRVMGNYHARFGVGENPEITSKDYLSLLWGGSNPDTSFDCSGFVSYVLTNSGLVNTGRLGAQGLYNVCTPVSKANAQPGDLIFFVGTYDTPGVSHVGIYVGDGVMIHCGDVRPDRTEVEVDERRAA